MPNNNKTLKNNKMPHGTGKDSGILNSGISKEVSEKGTRLFSEGRVRKEMDTGKRTYFTVRGETEEHSVIFDKVRGAWSCDCKFSSMKNRECSHIYACKLSVGNSGSE